MKASIATAISVSGVLVAGSAAAMVSSQVLRSEPVSTPRPAPVVASADTTTPSTSPTTVVGTTVAPTSTTVAAPAASAAAPVASTQGIYLIGDAGSVTLDTAGDMLTIVAVAPAAGWTVTEQESKDSLNIEVKLQSGTSEIEFKANLLFGVVSTNVELHDLSAAAQPATSNSVDDRSGRSGSSGGGHGSDDGGSDDHGGGDD